MKLSNGEAELLEGEISHGELPNPIYRNYVRL